tara:strand:+ start:2537 stop:2848 length:312 start_codon:yes stop_codon:yes gene_type:complete
MLIKIKFLGPTNYRGSRYKATVKDGDSFQYSAIVPSTYASDNSDALAAAQSVAEKIRIEMNARVRSNCSLGQQHRLTIKAYTVKIVGAYDGEHFATMTPVYSD